MHNLLKQVTKTCRSELNIKKLNELNELKKERQAKKKIILRKYRQLKLQQQKNNKKDYNINNMYTTANP